jgi:hypothetical protein
MNLDMLNTIDGNERLVVDDIDFLISARIEQAAPEMMIRELVQNSIEAALSAPKNHRKITISKELFRGVPKLCIHNTGTGMSSEELYNSGNLACVINKEHGLNKNFGEGAKVSSLLYNSFGMIYDSCKNGIVSRMWLNKEKRYGRRTFDDTRVVMHVSKSILDVSDEYSDDELSYDWTKAILLGKSADQDTVSDPYGTGKLKYNWLTEYLYHRFYRIDPTIEIVLHGAKQFLGRPSKEEPIQLFETIEQRRSALYETKNGTYVGAFSRSETVSVHNGIKLHFIHDAMNGKNRISSSRGGLQTDATFGGILYKNELYSFYKGNDWTSKCFRLGVSFGGNVLSIIVELPYRETIVPDAFRKNLIDMDRDRNKFSLEDYGDLVMTNLPEWVQQIIDDNSPARTTSVDDIEKKLKVLMAKLALKREVEILLNEEGEFDLAEDGVQGAEILVFPSGPPSDNPPPDDPPEKRKREVAHINHGDKATKQVTKPHSIFKIHQLTREQDVIEKGIVGKAALYVRSTNELFVNMLYPAIQKMFDNLIVFYPNADRALFTSRSMELIEKSMLLRVGSTAVRALAKQNNGVWSREEVDRALTPETLSMAADDDEFYYGLIKARLSAEFVSDKYSYEKKSH